MASTNWRDVLRCLFDLHQVRRPSRPRARSLTRPQWRVETLEDRTAPSEPFTLLFGGGVLAGLAQSSAGTGPVAAEVSFDDVASRLRSAVEDDAPFAADDLTLLKRLRNGSPQSESAPSARPDRTTGGLGGGESLLGALLDEMFADAAPHRFAPPAQPDTLFGAEFAAALFAKNVAAWQPAPPPEGSGGGGAAAAAVPAFAGNDIVPPPPRGDIDTPPVNADGNGAEGSTDSGTVSLMSFTNTPPSAFNDDYSVHHAQMLNVFSPGVLANDYDIDMDPLTAVLVSGPGSASSFQFNSDGSFDYQAQTGFTGTDSFTYQAYDGIDYSTPATVNIVVWNNAPYAQDDNYTLTGTQLSVDSTSGVLANDDDVDGDMLHAVVATGPSNGSLTLNPDGSFVYTPNAGMTSDSFTYQAGDGVTMSSPATVSISNSPPHAYDDNYSVQHGQTLNVLASGVLANDWDPDGSQVTAILVSNPGNGSLTLNPDGSFSYTPVANWAGTDSFTYKANDGVADSTPATVWIDVWNNAPYAQNDSYTLTGTQLSVDSTSGVLANDDDVDGDMLHAVVATGPSNGSLTLNPDGSFVYTPNAGMTSDSFTYQAGDGVTLSSPATVQISHSAPHAYDDNYSVQRGQTLNVLASGVLANDWDPDGSQVTAILVSNPGNGSLTLNPDGSFNYTPDANWAGMDFFTYKANDGVADSNPATVSIDVTNTAPIAVDDFYQVHHLDTLIVNAPGALDNDSDADNDPLTGKIRTLPAKGALMRVDGTPYAVNDSFDGSFKYKSYSGQVGEDSFEYEITDGVADDTATVWLNINNQSPQGTSDYYTMLMIHPLLEVDGPGVLANDSDPDGDPLTAVIYTQPVYGALLHFGPGGDFIYMAPQGGQPFVGTDSFQYSAFDGADYSLPVTVTINIIGVSLNWVTFEEGHVIWSDPPPSGPAMPYDERHWEDANLDGNPEKQWPVAYTRNTPIEVSARFVFSEPWDGAALILVRATGPDGIVIDTVADTTATEATVSNAIAGQPLPDMVYYYEEFELTWQMSVDGGNSWATVGTSSNPLYVTLGNPALGDGNLLYHTVVHIGSNRGAGGDNEAMAVEYIWDYFQNLNVRRVDGTLMTYWGGGDTTVATSTAALLSDADGQCGSWASLFLDVLKGQGIDSARKVVVLHKDQVPGGEWTHGILVKNWEFNGEGMYPEQNPYVYRRLEDAVPVEGIAGQGNANPRSTFANHFLVEFDNRYYDPSYGRGFFATQAEWEDHALAGFWKMVGGDMYAKPKDPNVVETQFIPL